MRAPALCAILLLAAGCAPPGNPDGSAGPEATPEPTGPGSSPTPTPIPPSAAVWVEWTGELPPVGGWSEGLDVQDGVLWQTFPSSIWARDAASGEVLGRWDPPSTYSESLTWLGGKLFNVSYHDANLYEGRLVEGELEWIVSGTTPHEAAWGIAHDGTRLILTGNGQPYLYFLDESHSVARVVETPFDDLEDIAWYGGNVFASSYSEMPGAFFRLDPETGELLDWHKVPDADACPIVDGIAIDAAGTIWVTGKDCPAVWVGRVHVGD